MLVGSLARPTSAIKKPVPTCEPFGHFAGPLLLSFDVLQVGNAFGWTWTPAMVVTTVLTTFGRSPDGVGFTV